MISSQMGKRIFRFCGFLFCVGGLAWGGAFASCSPTTTPPDSSTSDTGGTADTAKKPDVASQPDVRTTPDIGVPDGGSKPEKSVPEGIFDPAPADDTADKTPTNGPVWYGDIQTIVQKNCQVCHSEGGVGPFALTNYDQVKAKSSVVEWSVKNRRMPPWLPNSANSCEPFKHSINLPQKDIDAVVSWVKNGMPKGDAKDATTFQPSADKLAWVDAEVDIQTDYTPPKTPVDNYHCFLTKPVVQATTKELTGFQLIPGVREMVHHVLIYSVGKDYADKLKTRYNGTHWPCGTGGLFGSIQSQLLGVWVPGTDVVRFPTDTGMPVGPGSQLVLEFHYNLGSLKAPKADRTKIRLKYARTPVKYKLKLQLQVQFNLRIPPKSQGVEITHTQNVPAPVRLWGIMPHMHKQGTKFSLTVQTPGTNKACMIDIPRWDYGWQQTFFFNQPGGLLLTGKEKILMKCTFDNPTNQTIGWGDKTSDEMCLNFYFISNP